MNPLKLYSSFFSKPHETNIPSVISFDKIESKKSWDNYLLEIKDNTYSPWVIFKNKKAITNLDSIKYHVSLKRDPENLKKAFNLILPILNKHQISSFKVLPLSCIDLKGNTLGKEYVIYVQDFPDSQESSQEFWSRLVLKEIVDVFEKEGVEPGNLSKGDVAIKGGKNFIYSRSPNNIFGSYVAADFLDRLGFSFEESARLSPSPWVDLVIDGGYDSEKSALIKQPLNIPEVFPEVKVESDRIYSHFVSILSAKVNRSNIETIPALFYLVAGTTLKEQGKLKQLETFNFLFQKQDSKFQIEWAQKLKSDVLMDRVFDVKIDFMAPYLKKAAFLIASIQEAHYNTVLEKIGNIHPSIYHSFIVPLAKKLDSPANELFFVILTKDEEVKFINHIALCALRLEHPELDEHSISVFAGALFNK